MRVPVFSGVVCLLAASAAASIGPAVDIFARARGAARVVVATVVAVQPRFDVTPDGDRIIVSDLLLNVDETLKGTRAEAATVTVEGGELGGLTLRVSDMAVMRAGDRAVFFLDDGPLGRHVPHRRGLGILRLDAAGRIERSALTIGELRRQVQEALK